MGDICRAPWLGRIRPVPPALGRRFVMPSDDGAHIAAAAMPAAQPSAEIDEGGRGAVPLGIGLKVGDGEDSAVLTSGLQPIAAHPVVAPDCDRITVAHRAAERRPYPVVTTLALRHRSNISGRRRVVNLARAYSAGSGLGPSAPAGAMRAERRLRRGIVRCKFREGRSEGPEVRCQWIAVRLDLMPRARGEITALAIGQRQRQRRGEPVDELLDPLALRWRAARVALGNIGERQPLGLGQVGHVSEDRA